MKFFISLSLGLLIGCASKNVPWKDTNPAWKPTAATAPTTDVAPAQLPQKMPASVSEKISCTKGEDSRLLEVVAVGKGCRLSYMKSGVADVPASSASNMQYCERVKSQIREELENSGYQCL